jgi:hypothetical protein
MVRRVIGKIREIVSYLNQNHINVQQFILYICETLQLNKFIGNGQINKAKSYWSSLTDWLLTWANLFLTGCLFLADDMELGVTDTWYFSDLLHYSFRSKWFRGTVIVCAHDICLHENQLIVVEKLQCVLRLFIVTEIFGRHSIADMT